MSVFGRAGQVQMTFKRKFTRMTLYRGKQIGLVTTDVFLNTSVVHHIELMDGLEGKNQQYFSFFFLYFNWRLLLHVKIILERVCRGYVLEE